MVKITSQEELREWLKDKPADWAQVIAARAALRVLPYAFTHTVPQKTINDLILSVIRAISISWAIGNFSVHDMADAAARASQAAARTAARSDVFASVAATAHYAALVSRIAVPSNAFARVADVAARSAADAANAINAAARAFSLADSYYAVSIIWDIVSADCDWLITTSDNADAARRLTWQPLWLTTSTIFWPNRKDRATTYLHDLDQGYDVWIDWYERRIRGERAAFNIPGDSDRTEDKAILARLADATDEDFWDKGATYVNTTLQGWIEEARHRVRPKDYTQNPLAIGFGANPAGEVDVLPDMAGNRVLRDDDARDRHHIARAEARTAFAASSRDLTQAFEFDAILSDYLSALGEDVEAIRPSMLVLCGDKLRRLRAEYRSPASSKPPLAEAQAFALENWERAHNALVGIDPFLSAIERQSYGPDVPVIVIQLDAIKAVIDNAREAGVASAAAQDVLTDAVANVPAGATPDERRYRFSIESLKNFIRGTADLARKHGGKAVVGGYGAALWMQRNVEWLRDLFAGEQSILDLINWIATLPL